MFYIDKKINFTKRDIAFMHILPALAVLLIFLIISVWNWSDLRHSVAKEQQGSLDKYMNDTSQNLGKGLNSYVDVVNAGVGLFDASDYVNHSEWNRFISIFDLYKRYPGTKTVGFIKVIGPKELGAYTKSVRTNENMRFHVYPAGKNRTYASIVYASSKSGLNDGPIGYDMYSDKKLRAAMEQARDTGKAVITSYMTSSKVFGSQPQLMIFSPIYIKGSGPKNESQRKRDIWGYTYADILSYSFIKKIGDNEKHNFAYTVTAPDMSGGSTLLYKSSSLPRIDSSAGKMAGNQTVTVNNLSMNINGGASSEIVPKRVSKRPVIALWFGIILSFLLGIFIYTLLRNRTKALKGREFDEIQSAKDELLALASHQLRTPATGVKQYIGMLREGYGGKMTEEQAGFLDKAYESNERQLGIINDMLFVARADNGDIKFKFKKVDMLKLIRKILDEQENDIKNAGLKLHRRLPRSSVYVQGDETYLRMAVENIVNNAIKYTRSGGNITVRLRRTKSSIRLSVDDTGVGVDEKYRHLLFRKFSRVPNDLSSTVTGSGIGLYLAKKVADAHNGKIAFNSSDGQGSSCTITLPLKR